MPTKAELLNQLHSLRHTGFDKKLDAAAKSHGFSTSYFFAIASRETNCLNILGDFVNHQAHGVGIVQIDVQHDLARKMRDEGTWKTNPQPLIDFGAQIIHDNLAAVKKALPGLTDAQYEKVAASGYNCGVTNAINGSKHGDSDISTTGHNYGRDVMTRKAIFEELIHEGN